MKFIRETSDKVAEIIIEEASISNYVVNEIYSNRKMTILEPSAGKGKLIDVLFEKYNFSKNEINIDCVELNKENCEILKSKGYKTFQQDFLNFKVDYGFEYDRIIACPPFKGNVDLLHIKKMYEILHRKGIMVTLTSPFWITNNETIHIEFRKWLENKDYTFKMLPDNSFVEKGKTVPTGLLKIYKK